MSAQPQQVPPASTAEKAAGPPLARALFAAAVVMLMGLGAVLRFWRLDYEGFWLDELYTLRIALGHSSWQVVQNAAGDVHPPVFFLLLNWWARLVGSSDALLRALPTLFGTVLLPLVGLAAGRAGGRWAAVTAVGLLALMPRALYWCHELRMYSLLALLAVATFVCVCSLRTRVTGPATLALGALAVISPYVHYWAGLWLATGLALLVTGGKGLAPWRARARVAVQTALLSAACFAPWLPTMVRQAIRGPGSPIVPPWQEYPAALLGPMVNYGPETPANPEHAILAALALLVIGAGALSAWRTGRLRRELGEAIVYWAVPVGLLFVAAQAHPLWMLNRLAGLNAPFLALVLGLGVAALPRPGLRAAVAVVLLLAVAITGLGQHGYYHTVHRGQVREAVAWVAHGHAPGEPVVVSSPMVETGVRRYGPQLWPLLVMDQSRPPEAPARRAAAALRGGKRVWYVASHGRQDLAGALARLVPGAVRVAAPPLLDAEACRWEMPSAAQGMKAAP